MVGRGKEVRFDRWYKRTLLTCHDKLYDEGSVMIETGEKAVEVWSRYFEKVLKRVEVQRSKEGGGKEEVSGENGFLNEGWG